MDNRVLAVARGNRPADLLLKNARVINVFTGEILPANVAIVDGLIAGVGDYNHGREIIDLGGRYLSPGLIDGHVHLESSMLGIDQYARAVVPHGVTSVVTDLHEIANVCGPEGMRHVLDASRNLPLDIFLMAPTGVPATPLETSGATIGADELEKMLRWKHCLGLGEVMNYPGVLNGDPALLHKLALAAGHPFDGHAPGLSGNRLNAYISAGIYSDHESVSLEEAREKIRLGMHIMIREGSSEKNLETLLPLVNDDTSSRCLLVVDDRSCVDLMREGDVDAVVRRAVRLGLDPVRAIQMATINPATYFRQGRLGGIAPGYRANLVVFHDLDSLEIDMVFYAGRLVAADGRPLFPARKSAGSVLKGTMWLKPFGPEKLRMRSVGDKQPVIGLVPGQIVNRRLSLDVKTVDGLVVSDTENDTLKLAVVERHHATGNIGLGLVHGFGLKSGALASSVAHDSHNIVAVGTTDTDLMAAVREVERLGGGLVAADGGEIVAALPLPDAGLLSNEPLAAVCDRLEKLEQAAASFGCALPAPFSYLSFLALPVIPELRLTDLGLVDVNRFELIRPPAY